MTSSPRESASACDERTGAFTAILGQMADSRVLFVTNDFPPQRGGIQTFVRQLCEELPPEQVVVHAPSHPGDAEHDALLPYTVVRDPSSLLLPTPAAGRRIVDSLQQHRCDVVVYGASVPLGLMARRLRAAGAVMQVALTHGHEVWWAALPVTRRLLRSVAAGVEVMTYVSCYTRDRIGPVVLDERPRSRAGTKGSAIRAVASLASRKRRSRSFRLTTGPETCAS